MGVFVSDIGTILEINTGEDISSSSQRDFKLVKPDLNQLTKTAVFTNDGVDGLLRYVFVAGEIDQAGQWSVQAILAFGTDNYATDIGTFVVTARLF